MLVNAMNSNEEQLGLNKYQKRTCQAYCGKEGNFISSIIRRYNEHARKRKQDEELILCEEDGQSIQHHPRNSSIMTTQAQKFHK